MATLRLSKMLLKCSFIAITALTFILPVYYLYILIRLAVLVYMTRIAFIIHNMLVIRDWVM